MNRDDQVVAIADLIHAATEDSLSFDDEARYAASLYALGLRYPDPDSIDDAWNAVEAVLPERWALTLDRNEDGGYQAVATAPSEERPWTEHRTQRGQKTPAAALRAIASMLKR